MLPLLLTLVIGALLPAWPARAAPVNRVILQVNDRIATLKDYETRLGPRLAVLNRQEIDPDERQRLMARLPRDVMRDLFEEMLLLSRADQLSVNITDAQVDALLVQVREANGIATNEELQRAVAQTGQTWTQFRAELAKTQRSQEVVGREVYGRIDLEDDDLRIFYRDNPELFRIPQQRRLKAIIVLGDSELDAEALQNVAQGVSRRLNEGESPEAIAEELSEPGITSGVIDLDWVPAGDLDPALEAAVEGLEPGQASAPTVGRGGLHVIQVQEIQEARIQPFEEVQETIFARERNRLFEREFPKYLAELAEKSYIRANPPSGAEGFRDLRDAVEAEDDPLELFRRPGAPAPLPAADPISSDSEG